MAELRGLLYREMVRFERPKSLFGKVPYGKEQSNIRKTVLEMDTASKIYDPMFLHGVPRFIRKRIMERITEEKRRKKVIESLIKTKQKLSEIVP
jgi:hypothetical protein